MLKSGDGKTGTVRQRTGEVAGDDDEQNGFGIVGRLGAGGGEVVRDWRMWV